MISSLLITLRETLEAVLVIILVAGVLRNFSVLGRYRLIAAATASGVAVSAIAALFIRRFIGAFEGATEEIFEGTVMIVGAVLLTTLIVWMTRRRNAHTELKERITRHATLGERMEIFGIVFLAVLREGIETVIFLSAAWLADPRGQFLGATIGILGAVALGFAFSRGFTRLNLKHFFTIATLLLIFVGAGLLAHGLGEYAEAGVLPAIVDPVWNLNPSQDASGAYPLLHEKGAVGSFARGLFGYNGDPSLLELLGWCVYAGGSGALLWNTLRRKTA